MEIKSDTVKKGLIGLAAGAIVISAFAAYKYFKGRKVKFISGNDDDVVYVVLDDSKKSRKIAM